MYFVHLNFKQRSNRIIKYYRDLDQLIQNKVLKENLHQPAACERELKCMVAFIDWYHLRINASEREKIKVGKKGIGYLQNEGS